MNEFEHNRKAYNEIAESYHQKRQDRQSGAWNEYLEVPAIESLLKPLVRDQKVLDLGCGTGFLTQKIIDWGGVASGVDQSEKMIDLAKANLPDLNLQVASATKLPFDDECFDVVASSLVMHYLKDLQPAFSEASRVLKTGGYFIFSMHHPIQESIKLDKSCSDGKPIFQPYFNNNHYYWKMCGVEFLSFHHTFEDIIQDLGRTNFTVQNLIECRPPENSRDNFKDFEFTSNYPSFCVFSAKKL